MIPPRLLLLIPFLLATFGRAQAAPAGDAGELDARVERLLAFIPATAASHDEGVVEGEQIRVLMRPQLRACLQAGMPVPPEQIHAWARALAESELDHEVLLRQARAAGYQPDPAKARLELAKRRDSMGGEQFAETMALQGVGEDVVLRKLAENGAVSRWLAEQVGATIELDEDDAKAYFEEHRKEFVLPVSRQLWHILVAQRQETTKERRRVLRRNAEEMLARIREGMPFQRVARAGSDCPSAANDGNLGLVSEDRLNKELLAVSRKLRCGEISGVIESPAGFHLLMAGASASGRKLEFREVREQIMEQLRGEAVGQAMDRVKERARAATHARVHIAAGDK